MKYGRESWAPNSDELAAARRDAAWLLRTARNVVLGTVGPQGDPHTTVLGKNFDIMPPDAGGARMFFWSFPDTRHAQNIEGGSGRVRIQLLDAGRNFGAVALSGIARRLQLPEIRQMLPGFNARRQDMEAMPPRVLEEFTHSYYPKAMYQVTLSSIAELPVRAMDPQGQWAGDIAYRVPLSELMGGTLG
jgi:hypothetical protein